MRNGQADEAGALLFENNPLSAITGSVCPNHLYCQGSCVLNKKNNPVDFGKIEKEISANYLDVLASKRKRALKPFSFYNPFGLLFLFFH